jgi:plasmid stabilization system protein ParE
MQYLVRLTDRALRDMEAIYGFIEAATSEAAFAWFNELTEAISSLERYPERGAVFPESRKFRHLLFGKKQATYRIIYAVDKRNTVVNILHIHHGARAPFRKNEDLVFICQSLLGAAVTKMPRQARRETMSCEQKLNSEVDSLNDCGSYWRIESRLSNKAVKNPENWNPLAGGSSPTNSTQSG